MFAESHWSHSMGVDAPASTANQAALAQQCLQAAGQQRVLLFLNVAAIHKPNRVYLRGCKADNLDSHAAALRYVDRALEPLLAACAARAPTFVIICSDHGSAYGKLASRATAWRMKPCGTSLTRIFSLTRPERRDLEPPRPRQHTGATHAANPVPGVFLFLSA